MKIINQIISSINFNGNFCLIGIDGPTASGKTTLADNLSCELSHRDIPNFIYRLDWTLSERTERMVQLDIIMKSNMPFRFEASIHMNLEKAADFLKIVETERYNTEFSERIIHLTELYNREDKGRHTGLVEFMMKRNMVVIIEGHYTHHPLLRRYIDQNYLLAADPDILLMRKSARVKAYRDHEAAGKYFRLIDLPSFSHYYYQNRSYISNIILNQTYEDQQRISHEEFQKLLFVTSYPELLSPGKILIPDCNADSDSRIKDVDLFFGHLISLHPTLVQLWGIHPKYRSVNFAEHVLASLDHEKFALVFSEFQQQNSNEFSYELGFSFREDHIIVCGNMQRLSVLYASNHIKQIFRINCDSNGLPAVKEFKRSCPERSRSEMHYLITPNKFLIPHPFKTSTDLSIRHYKSTGHIWDYADLVFFNSSLFVLRARYREQSDFYIKFLKMAGFDVICSGDYLFAENLVGRQFYEKFRTFYHSLPNVDDLKHLRTVIDQDIQTFEELGCTLSEDQFVLSDKANINKLIDLYIKSSPAIKNIITQNLRYSYPDRNICDGISIDEYIRNLPVHLMEFYFSLFISGNGAAPCITLYHAKKDGIDIQTYFDYYFNKGKSFGLQASGKALGLAKSNRSGYLKIRGPKALADIVKENLLTFLKKHPNAVLPPWGCGIDHAAPDGELDDKAFILIREAENSNWFTSYCIDASHFITGGMNRAASEAVKAFIKNIFCLLGRNTPDIEFYLGNEKVFAETSLHESLKLYKMLSSDFVAIAHKNGHHEFFLFGPFLGTLHHQMHKEVDPDLSSKIFDQCSENGFLGNVLHGTSYTPFGNIRSFVNSHCIKINFAGKLLEAIVKGLPPEIIKKLGSSNGEWKYYLPDIQPGIIRKEGDLVKAALCKVLDNIDEALDLPVMTDDEIKWFRDKHVCLPAEDFAEIVKDIATETHKIKTKKHRTEHYYLASMIEVPFSEFSGGLAERVIKSGIMRFHIDIGDSHLISRRLDGLEKLEYLARYYRNAATHLHLMVSDVFSDKAGVSLIKRISSFKPFITYVHPVSFQSLASWHEGAALIRKAGSHPGVVLAVDEKMNLSTFLNQMKEAGIHHILVMGVPIGRGGQSFRQETIRTLKRIRTWAAKNEYQITVEVDGGLSDAVLQDCIGAGAYYLSGWSMYLKYGVENIEKRINELLNG